MLDECSSWVSYLVAREYLIACTRASPERAVVQMMNGLDESGYAGGNALMLLQAQQGQTAYAYSSSVTSARYSARVTGAQNSGVDLGAMSSSASAAAQDADDRFVAGLVSEWEPAVDYSVPPAAPPLSADALSLFGCSDPRAAEHDAEVSTHEAHACIYLIDTVVQQLR